jgi:molybdate transport system permease protein
MKFNHRSRYDWIFIIPSLALTLLLGLPVLALLWRGLSEGFLAAVLTPTALSALKLSLITSSIALCIILITGTPLAFTLARWQFSGKAPVELLIDLPIVLPPSVAGVALLMAFGRQGLFGGWLAPLGISIPFTTTAVVLAQIFVSAPFFVRSARIGFSSIDHQIEEAAIVEGVNEWQLFRHIMFPLAGRAMLSGAILAWTRALGEFGATILFAGNLEGVTQTMPLAIYLGFERSLGVALALSVMLVGVSLFLLAIMRKLDKNDKSG